MIQNSYRLWSLGFLFLLMLTGPAYADDYSRALKNFSSAPQTQHYIKKSYGYALFPSVGKAGFAIGAAYGKGRVYRRGVYVGDSKLTQVSIGFQLGAQEFSEIIFFEDRNAFENFITGNFEFNAQASAVAVNFGATAQAGTTGNSAGAGQSGGVQASAGQYVDGMAIFTAPKGGLMFEASLAGQSFSYKAKH